MNQRARRAGDSKLGCAVWLLALVVVALICWKAIPVKLASAELYDYMEEQAKFAGNAPPEVLKKQILQKARELELPVSEKQLVVERLGDNIRMHCFYEVPLEFPGYTYIWKFEHLIRRPVFIV
jgi:hypothetical protein